MMTNPEANHTPGPWHKAPGRYIINIFATDPITQCDHILAVVQERGEKNANANLIAAAPDLLAACEAVLGALHWVKDAPMVSLIQSAIARAKGLGS